jgi:hypothetical protein
MDGLNTKTVDKLAAQHLGPVFGNSPWRCTFWFKADSSEFVLLEKIYGGYF